MDEVGVVQVIRFVSNIFTIFADTSVVLVLLGTELLPFFPDLFLCMVCVLCTKKQP